MTFRFIDRILAYEPYRTIHAYKLVTRQEAWFYQLPSGDCVLSPAVVSEAMAQASGWLAMVSFDFTRRPVLLADEETDYYEVVRPGDCLEIFSTVTRCEDQDDMLNTRSEARVAGKLVARSDCTRGYLLPLSDFADPELMRKNFQHVYRPGNVPASRPAPTLDNARPADQNLGLIDGLLDVQVGKSVKAYKNVTISEPYFAEHFPRHPVVPGVVLMSSVGEACQFLSEAQAFLSKSISLVPISTQNIRFRKFVEPGDQCLIDIQVLEGDPAKIGTETVVAATIHANGSRVMSCRMTLYALGQDVGALRDQRQRKADLVAQPGL